MSCRICSREIVPCDECDGSGVAEGVECEVCEAVGKGCPVHHAEAFPEK